MMLSMLLCVFPFGVTLFCVIFPLTLGPIVYAWNLAITSGIYGPIVTQPFAILVSLPWLNVLTIVFPVAIIAAYLSKRL